MDLHSFLPEAIHSLIILLGLTFLLTLILRFIINFPKWQHRLLLGIAFGITSIATMFYGFVISEGIVGDLRNVVVLSAGVFGGSWVAGISAIIAGIYRVFIGGKAEAALIGIFLAAAIGTIYNWMWLSRNKPIRVWHLLLLGAALAVSGGLLPWLEFFTDKGLHPYTREISKFLLTIGLIVYPIATFLMCQFISLKYREILNENILKNSNAQLTEQAEQIEKTNKILADKIVEKEKTEEKLRDMETRLNYILNFNPAGIYLLSSDSAAPDMQFKPSFISKSVETMVGYDLSEWMEEPDFWIKHLHPDDSEKALNGYARLFEQDWFSHEYRFRHKNGSYRWIYDELILLRNKAGKPYEIIGAWVDITDHKQTVEQLQRAQRMEIIGRLIGGISHDFNNLLAIILGNLQLLQRRLKQDGTVVKHINVALDATLRGRDLTRNLLTFSRRQILEPTVLSVNEVIVKLQTMMRQAIDATIDVNLSLANDLWPIKVDPTHLESALLNLCINARDAMPSGGRLVIETANIILDEFFVSQHQWMIKQGPYVMISISDTGIGISRDIQDKIFEPFFTTKKEGKGTGLGLSMVYGFIKQSGGHIIVCSEENVGATFKLYFPRAERNDIYSSKQDLMNETKLPTGNETILIVEDNPDVKEIHALLLRELGYKVLEADNAHQALALLEKRQNIDLLFSDVVMPGKINGFMLAQELLIRIPKIKILLTSGYPKDIIDPQQENNNIKTNQYYFISKPFTKESLALKLRKILDEPFTNHATN